MQAPGTACLLLAAIATVACRSLESSNTIFLELNPPTLEEIAFLKKYGYMEDAGEAQGATFTPQSAAEAVRKMQEFAGLPPTGVLDTHTRKLFKTKRCGVKDIDTGPPARSRRYIINQGWDKTTITYKVVNGSSSLGLERVEALVAAGLAVWAPHGGLRFQRVHHQHADISVLFARRDHGDGFPFDGQGRVVAHAFPPPHGAIHFDDDEIWGDSDDAALDFDSAPSDAEDVDVTDFFAVAVHEIGHALGLSHSNVKSSVMYPYYQVPVETLHMDDILGMQELYYFSTIVYEWPHGTCYYKYSNLFRRSQRIIMIEHHLREYSAIYRHVGEPLQTREVVVIMPIARTRAASHRKVKKQPVYADPSSLATDSAPRFTKASEEELDENYMPDLCMTNYDTLQVLNGKIYVFEEEWVWVLRARGVLEAGFPQPFHDVFRGLPARVSTVRTVYQRFNGNVVIFSGRQYWEFSASEKHGDAYRLVHRGRLVDYSLPAHVPELSTVFISNYNNKTYLIEEERFWRYDEGAREMDPGYPKEMSAWRQVPYPVDAAIVWHGDTFFFLGPRFWRFDNRLVAAHAYYPLPVAQIWFGCPYSPDMNNYVTNDGP